MPNGIDNKNQGYHLLSTPGTPPTFFTHLFPVALLGAECYYDLSTNEGIEAQVGQGNRLAPDRAGLPSCFSLVSYLYSFHKSTCLFMR